MDVQQLRPGLWRWTAPHPAWAPAVAWPQEVGCVYYEAPEATVLIDPLVPEAADGERFWRALDRDVERRGLPLAVVLTAPWHRRSADEVAARYGASVWTRSDGVPPPAGVVAFSVPPVDERQVALLLPEHGALVTAEILASLDGELRVCPSPALENVEALALFLDELRGVPIDLVLPAHGAPVLEDAPGAVRRAVERFSAR
jgi:hypothetical protein